jgi:hypothetical protein
MLRVQLDRTITLSEGGKSKNMKMREVVSQALINAAAKGNVFAQREVLKAMRQLELRDAERAKTLAEQQEVERQEEIASYRRMAHYKVEREIEWAKAVALGSEPNDIWPHPDDILLFPNQHRWRIRGPVDETDFALFNWYRAERDYLLAYAILNERLAKKASQLLTKLYTHLWISYDVKLPLRWQIFHKFEFEYFRTCILTTKKLRTLVVEREERSEYLKLLAGISNNRDKESYRMVNMTMKPLLKQKGYRSLAQFEHAFESHGVNMPWPKGNTENVD